MADQIYDIAISFLVRDERAASSIAERLEAAELKVFFFPHRQEELAGTNGMESMRAPFLEARVNVVLFRKTWGETPWTRIEDGAISERCFKGGWSSLMFVELEKASALPKWLPSTHIRFNFEDYGIDQLLGAIKFRVQEHGGTIKPLDALDGGSVYFYTDYNPGGTRYTSLEILQRERLIDIRRLELDVG